MVRSNKHINAGLDTVHCVIMYNNIFFCESRVAQIVTYMSYNIPTAFYLDYRLLFKTNAFRRLF